MNGVGLDRDVSLVADTLREAGFEVSVSPHHRIKSLWRILQRKKKFDANIFIERVHTRWCGLAKKNFLIPNQERFPKRLIKKLKYIDTVFTKTVHATEIFSQYSKNVEFIGFTSNDLYDEKIEKHFDRFLHLAGKSSLKGTEQILDIWTQHPEWPQFTLLQQNPATPLVDSPNITVVSEILSNEQLTSLLNEHGVHLCPSRAEGWGHYIVEGMACAALIVTTDGPPMNEIVSEQTGILIQVTQEKKRHLGVEYFIDKNALQKAIEELINSSQDAITAKGSNARRWFLQNDEEFKKRFVNVVLSQMHK